ncbi:DUF934 domain-containing protein [Dechloromonas sp. XY25]|uniref:DUF934 domain-containing protein n=1 Tax=Dechloromonas hankyongensis TaxID=2908002 RepID=A0ABS9K346_9RHOO|nr:DUF934 domain-containing protein [Dechloromonas hankyongensis]MCG2577606.1 DUF934 domain-containing protein [Dechloromonas hankyongensis]
MKQIIEDGRIVEDAWLAWDEADAALIDLPATAKGRILPLPTYVEHAERLLASGARLGVLIGPDDAPETVLPYLEQLALVAIRFPSFADGRGYSVGRLLRSRYGFTGQLRAVGDILRDQLYFLNHCGFNAFELRQDQDLREALAAFRDYAWQPNTLTR